MSAPASTAAVVEPLTRCHCRWSSQCDKTCKCLLAKQKCSRLCHPPAPKWARRIACKNTPWKAVPEAENEEHEDEAEDDCDHADADAEATPAPSKKQKTGKTTSAAAATSSSAAAGS